VRCGWDIALLQVRDGEVRVVIVLTIRDGLVQRMDAIADRNKLVHVNALLEGRLRRSGGRKPN